MKRVNCGHGHGLTPCHIVVLRMLRTVAREQNPTIGKTESSIEFDQIVPVLTFTVAC